VKCAEEQAPGDTEEQEVHYSAEEGRAEQRRETILREKLGTNTASRCSAHPTQHGARHPAREKKGRERKETKQGIHLHHTTRDTTRRSYHRVDLLGDDPDGVDDAGDPAEDGEHDGDQELNLQVQSQGTKQTALRNLNLASYYTVMHMHEHDGCERNGISGS
jgi:hypothetical protein